jgi:uncharacterized protein YdeI (YjbR/CyaY-like superfamily)
MPERPILYFADAAEWEAWLVEHHDDVDGVRLAIGKKGNPVASVSYAGALDVALCWGWIDGIKHGLDDNYFLQTFVPRRPKSLWSKVNVGKVAALIEAGRMQPAGHAEIEKAKADGRWDAAYAGSATIEAPAEFIAALSPAARAFYEKLSSQNRFAILFRIHNVKRAETRARKIAEYAAMMERGETIYPQKTVTD